MAEQLTVLTVVITGAAFLSVAGVMVAIRGYLNPERTARDRVADLTGARKDVDSLIHVESAPSLGTNIAALARPSNEEEADLVRKKLVQAGFRKRNAMDVYNTVRVVLAIGLPTIAYLVMPEMKQLIYTLFFVMLSAAVGYFGPEVYLNSVLTARQEALMRPFPDALDLLVSSVEAGLGLDAALRRIAVEMEGPAPELARELQLVNHEIASGMPRVEALRRLDARTGLAEVNSLVNVLLQAERFGTSVARSLRAHGEIVRKKRMLAAEEAAARISPKLTVVMILFIMPVIMMVLIGPAGINLYRNLLPIFDK